MKLTTLFNNTIFNLNLSNMKQKFMKQGLITLALVVGMTAMAQTTNVDNITKQTEAVLGGETTTVEAIPTTMGYKNWSITIQDPMKCFYGSS